MKKCIKVFFVIFVLMVIVVLIRSNITITKEPSLEAVDNTMKPLEVSSELVQKLFNKLIILENDNFDDSVYKDVYFVFDGDYKKLKPDEKLYITFEALYGEGVFQEEKLDAEIEVLSVDKSLLKEKYKYLFGEDLSLDDISYSTSINTGIIDYKDEQSNVVLKVKRAESDRDKKAKVLNAYKKGDFIELNIKAFYGVETKPNSKGEIFYKIRNYDSKKILERVTLDDFKNDSIYDKENLNSYTFSFMLKGEEYCLESIKKNN